MTTTRFICIVLVNICLNLGMIWLLHRWLIRRKQAAYHALCRNSRTVCQQVKQLEETSIRKEEVLS